MRPIHPRDDAPASNSDRLLDSWKEIASYLGRAVRTVQGWEKTEGLPVHRHHHQKAGTVYANASEIDAWRAERSNLPANGESPGPSRRRGLLIAASALIALAVVVYVASRIRDRDELASLDTFAPEQRSWLLIADFDNQTGELLLDGALEAGLRREIASSRSLSVARRERVADTLELMGKPTDSSVDAALASEVAVRDGGIGAIMTGKISRLGSTYMLSVEISRPADGFIIASLAEEAQEEAELPSAVRRLSNRVSHALGAAPPAPEATSEPLRRVSTPSLRALHLYSKADELLLAQSFGGSNRGEEAEILLREAVAEDPGFASAHLLLAFATLAQGRPLDAQPHADRSLELIEGASEREAYYIRASHHAFSGDLEAAIPIYRVLISQYPDHFRAHHDLYETLRTLGQWDEALEARIEMVSLRPNNFVLNYLLAADIAALNGLRASLPYIEHARTLMRPEEAGGQDGNDARAWLEVMPTWSHWLRDDLQPLVVEADRLSALIEGTPEGFRRQSLIWVVFGLDSALGRLDRVDRWAEMVEDDFYGPYRRLNQLYFRGDSEALRRWLDRNTALFEQRGWIPPMIPELLAQLGEPDKAEALLDSGRLYRSDLTRAHIHLARGQIEEARSAFEEALPTLPSRGSRYFIAMEALAEAHRRTGDPAEARRILEEASSQRSQSVGTFSGHFWLKHQMHLADLYREIDLVDEAQVVESELRALLALADGDHPLVMTLSARS